MPRKKVLSKYYCLLIILWIPDAEINSLEKTLMVGNIEGKRRRQWQKMNWLDSITKSMNLNLRKFQELVKGKKAWHAAVQGSHTVHDLVIKQQQ